ncbi:MAG: hypothetical protein ACRDPI_01475, partial [Nocardioidaceae bacterium]
MSPSEHSRSGEHRLGITATQVAGSALAAVSAAVAASYLGVSGTVIGAALGSVVATVGSATYTASLRRGSAVVRRTALTVRTITPRGTVLTTTKEPVDDGQTRVSLRERMAGLPWPRLALAAVSVLVVALGAITVFEAVTGRPVSSITDGTSDHGTTLGHVVSHSSTPQHRNPAEAQNPPVPTPSSSPSTGPTSPSASPSATPSAPTSGAPST